MTPYILNRQSINPLARPNDGSRWVVASISVCWQGLDRFRQQGPALTYLKGVDQADVSAALHLMAQRG